MTDTAKHPQTVAPPGGTSEPSLRELVGKVLDELRSIHRILRRESPLLAEEDEMRPTPVGFHLFGDACPVTTWRGAYAETIRVLAAKHPDTFREKVLALYSPLLAFPEAPKNLNGTKNLNWTEEVPGCWFQTNASARMTLQNVDRLLTAFGYDPEEVRRWGVEEQ